MLPSKLPPLNPCSVSPSLAEKVMRLKQAKAEAEAEIAAYKAQREAQFQVFSKEVRRCATWEPHAHPPLTLHPPPPCPQRMGDSAGYSSNLAKNTEAELAQISTDVSKNKQKVIAMLLKSVTTVA